MDIFPTIVDLLNLPDSLMTSPVDGMSLAPLFKENVDNRTRPVPFRYRNKGALIDNNYKLIAEDIAQKQYTLYDLQSDSKEETDILENQPEKGAEMILYFEKWLSSISESVEGSDYVNGLVVSDPEPQFWWDAPLYQPYIEQWKDRPEYHFRLERAGKL